MGGAEEEKLCAEAEEEGEEALSWIRLTNASIMLCYLLSFSSISA